MVINISAARKH